MTYGIDYGMGETNVDKETRIRYGVIPANSLLYWYDEAESDYGDPTCPKCGNEAKDYSDIPDEIEEKLEGKGSDYYCEDCLYCFFSDEAYPEQPNGYYIKGDDFQAFQGGDDTDVFVIKSLYYTYARFCSPCAPGACYILDSTGDSGVKCYCPSPEEMNMEDFREKPAIFLVKTGEQVW